MIYPHNLRDIWRGLSLITKYKYKSVDILTNVDKSLPDKLNVFFSRFEREHPPHLQQTSDEVDLHVPNSDTCRAFSRLKIRKAPGPDAVSPCLLKHCCQQLAPIFTSIFNWSLQIQKFHNALKIQLLFLFQSGHRSHV